MRMHSNLRLGFLSCGTALLVTLTLPLAVQAQDAEKKKNEPAAEARDAQVMERVMVFGSEDRREEIPGSAYIVGKETFDRYQYTDVHRVLREVPGVNIQEEDGFGLRPNIGMRGGRVDRSADITLMEDGVLIAPAPYAAPAAYYFPQMERMEGAEVIKGAGNVRHGPRTTNGTLNLITKSIPNENGASGVASIGTYDTRKAGATAGGRDGIFGYLLNVYHKESGGFKDIDFVGGDTGYDVQDIMGKFRVSAPASAKTYQHIEFKGGMYDEVSDETYLGLTDADFNADPYRRYASSQLDEMNVEQQQLQLQHFIEFNPNLDLTTTLYRNDTKRSWYKLDSVTAGGVKRGISDIFADTVANAAHLDVLRGPNSAADAFHIRDNNREYYAQGVQSVLGYSYEAGKTSNQLQVGARLHSDEEDRFQRDDRFGLTGGRAQLSSLGAEGSESNRISSADAWSGFVENEVSFGRWTVTPGVRYESIDLKREDFGKSDPNRTGSALAVLEKDVNVLIPGIAASYALTEEWKLFSGVHKGFAPPGVPGSQAEADFTEEEESVNYEVGTRYGNKVWNTEVVGFFNDYSNLLGRDTLSAGGGGTGSSFNGGEVHVYGLEAQAGYNLATLVNVPSGFTIPATVGYTFTQAKFQNSFSSSFEEWGNVQDGDELPYIPEHQLYVSLGLETEKWGVSTSAKYVDEMRTQAGSGTIPAGEGTDSNVVVDLAGEYELTKGVRAFVAVDNLFDEEYVAARRPAGARPGAPLTALAGIKLATW